MTGKAITENYHPVRDDRLSSEYRLQTALGNNDPAGIY